MNTSYLPLLLSLAMLNACGKEDNKDAAEQKLEKESSPDYSELEQVSSEEMTSETEISGPIIEASIDESLSSLAEEPDDATAALLSLTEEDAAKGNKNGRRANVSMYRNCTVEGDAAHVEIQKKLEKEINLDLPRRTMVSTFEMFTDIERIWTKDGSEITCGDNDKFAKLPLLDMEGVSLAVEFSRTKSRAGTVTNKVKNTTWSASSHYEAAGSRNIAWDAISEQEENYLVERTLNSEVSHKLAITLPSGEVKKFAGQVTVSTDAPLKISALHDQNLKVTQRSIKSGTVEAESAEGKITTIFDNVVYAAGSCMPKSGTISGSIDPSVDGQETVTFEIKFDGSSSVNVEYSNGLEYSYAPQGCDVEEVEAVEEVESPIASADS
jgi:hypothetical protein